MLVRRSLGDPDDENFVQDAVLYFMGWYREHKLDNTYVYDHVLDTLQELESSNHGSATRKMAVLSNKPVLDVADLSAKLPLATSVERGPGGEGGKLKDQVIAAEKRAIQGALDAAGGNRAAAAKRLGVSLRTLFYKMVRHRLG